jgi:hypothetical protein
MSALGARRVSNVVGRTFSALTTLISTPIRVEPSTHARRLAMLGIVMETTFNIAVDDGERNVYAKYD